MHVDIAEVDNVANRLKERLLNSEQEKGMKSGLHSTCSQNCGLIFTCRLRVCGCNYP